ncbi:MAG: hypothetical protein ACKKMR_03290 [Candidatus Nealsonbacteria bacterium]
MATKKLPSIKKEYIITYKSREHYEVLGWVIASSLKEAKSKARQKLLKEAKYYNVSEAEIGEWKDGDNIHFNIS